MIVFFVKGQVLRKALIEKLITAFLKETLTI